MDNADVRLRLGPVVEDDRALGLDEPALTERPIQGPGHQEHRRPVRTVLRLLDEQQAIEQLDGVVLVEKARGSIRRSYSWRVQRYWAGCSAYLISHYSSNNAMTGAAKPGRMSSPESVSVSVSSAYFDERPVDVHAVRPRIDEPDELHVGGEVLAKLRCEIVHGVVSRQHLDDDSGATSRKALGATNGVGVTARVEANLAV